MELDEIDTLLKETGTRLGVEPVATAPHDVAATNRQDVTIHDPRRYIPGKEPNPLSRPMPSVEEFFNPAEIEARRQAEDIDVRRKTIELAKLKRQRKTMSGEADQGIFAPLEKRWSKGYKLMQQRPKSYYRTQQVGGAANLVPRP